MGGSSQDKITHTLCGMSPLDSASHLEEKNLDTFPQTLVCSSAGEIKCQNLIFKDSRQRHDEFLTMGNADAKASFKNGLLSHIKWSTQ